MEPFAVEQIDHVEFFVPDQRAAADWYEEVLGLRAVPEFEHWADGGPLMLTTPSAGTKLALFEGDPVEATARAAFRRVAFRVDGAGFAAFLGRLDELHLETETGRRVGRNDYVDHGAAWSIYFVDPWGHRFEITTYEVDRAGELLA